MKLTRLAFLSSRPVITQLIGFAFALLCAVAANAASTTVVISQFYGGGGNSGAPYQSDFVELFNKSASPVSLNGWSVQYASSTGAFNGVATLPNVSLQPGQYFLVQLHTGTTGSALPTPDASSTTIDLSGTTGKIALANIATSLGTVTLLPDSRIVDFVGYGTSASIAEGGAKAPAPSNTTAGFRASDGCTDTDNNGADFSTAPPAPRNTATTVNLCSGGGLVGFIQVETKADGTGTVVPAQTLTAGNSITVYAIQRDANTNFLGNVAADSWVLGKSGAVVAGDLVPSGDLKSAVFTGHGAGTGVITANLSTANTISSGGITVVAGVPTQVRVETAANGTGVVVPAQTVVSGQSVTMYAVRRDAYTNFVDNVAADAWSLSSKTGNVLDTDLTPSSDHKSAVYTGNGTGTATVHATSGALTTTDSGVLNIVTVPASTLVISQVYGAGGNSGATYNQDFVELFNRTGNPINLNGWSIQYASSVGSFSSANVAALPNVSIPAYSYYLIGLTNGTNGINLPTPDFVAQNLNMSGSDGKVALANTTTALGAISWPDSRILDLVGYGGATAYEGSGAAPTTSSTTSAQRKNAGCTDTDNNNTDFEALSPSPRNSASGINTCPSQTPPTISSIPNQALDASAPVGPVSFDVNDQQTPAANLIVTASSSNPTLLPNNQITFGGAGIVRTVSLNPVSGQTGSAQVTVTVTDGDGQSAQSSFYLFVGTGPQIGMVFYDDFSSYSDGTSLSFVGDTSGGGWHTTSGNPYQLIVSNQQAQVALTITNSEDVAATLTNSSGFPVSVTPDSGTILYVGFKLTQTVLPTANGEYFLHLKDTTTSNFFGRVYANTANAAAGKFRLALSNHSPTPPNVQLPIDLDLNTTYNVLMRYKVGVGISTLWVNPTSLNDTNVTATDNVSNPLEIDMVALREPGTSSVNGAAGSQAIDNLAVSTSVNDVITFSTPPPTPPTLTAVRGASSFAISWPTNNNSGYVLQTASTVNAATWNAVGGVTTSGANYTVTVLFTSTPAYFRLKK